MNDEKDKSLWESASEEAEDARDEAEVVSDAVQEVRDFGDDVETAAFEAYDDSDKS